MCGDDGRPLLSWRVLLLPYLGDDSPRLYEEFHLDESWDSPHNLSLLARMPRTYEAPLKRHVDVPPNHTLLKVFVGPGTAFERKPAGLSVGVLLGPAAGHERFRGLPLSDFPDGLGETLLYVEAGDPVPWTKPEDIPFDPNRPVVLRGLFRGGACRSGMVDGAAYKMIEPETDWTILRARITRNGGEVGTRY